MWQTTYGLKEINKREGVSTYGPLYILNFCHYLRTLCLKGYRVTGEDTKWLHKLLQIQS